HFSALVSFTAALIVLGGTFGATMVSNTVEDLTTGLHMIKQAFQKDDHSYQKKVASQIIDSAKLARSDSMLAVEKRINGFSDPFMKNVFRFMVDGVDASTLRDVFEAEMDLEERRLVSGAKIWLDAGGFAPTVGILGAVLGLIHVMANLTDTSQLGRGIAVAFIATIYGVGSANLFFIPIGNKLKNKVKVQIETKEMILEGAVAIVSGLNPFVIEQKINSYIDHKTY
ncbi:MAG: flagellar motor protein, partial [Bdellovibrionales bacterium]|nr:flagellar motor protein [Bdellovibrionales bacterium]